jgi:hypothetical protein
MFTSSSRDVNIALQQGLQPELTCDEVAQGIRLGRGGGAGGREQHWGIVPLGCLLKLGGVVGDQALNE